MGEMIYWVVCDDGTYWRMSQDLETKEITEEEITLDEFLDAKNTNDINIEDWT